MSTNNRLFVNKLDVMWERGDGAFPIVSIRFQT